MRIFETGLVLPLSLLFLIPCSRRCLILPRMKVSEGKLWCSTLPHSLPVGYRIVQVVGHGLSRTKTLRPKNARGNRCCWCHQPNMDHKQVQIRDWHVPQEVTQGNALDYRSRDTLDLSRNVESDPAITVSFF